MSITKVLVSGAIALGIFVGGAAPASAAPQAPNPYSTLHSNRPETAPVGSPALMAEIDRGIQEGLSAWLPGLPAPTQPGQPRQ